MFSNLWSKFYTEVTILDIKYRFTCGELSFQETALYCKDIMSLIVVECKKIEDAEKTKKQQILCKIKDGWFEKEHFKGIISKKHPRNGNQSLFFNTFAY